jgi:benzoylformate decarboxylase
LPFEPFLYSDQAAQLPKPYVKWSCEPARAEDVPLAIARAYYVAMQQPRGPTLVSVPVDDWDRPCEPVEAREASEFVVGDPALLARAAASLSAARRPVVVVGASIARDDAWDETIALAERYEAPVWVSPRSSRNSFPEDHRLFAGFLPPVFTYHVEGNGPHIPPGAALVQLTDDPSVASWAPVGLSIVTNLKSGVAALGRSPNTARRPAWVAPIAPSQMAAAGLTETLLMQRIAALRPRGAIIVEEAPSSRGAMQRHLPMSERDSFFTCASGGLGHGLPAAVGVALARPDRKVIALLGDGSAMYSIQGLWNAAQLGLGVAFVVVNNRSYRALNEFGRHFGLDSLPGTNLPGLDFRALAESQGVTAVRVERRDDLESSLAAAFSATRPMLLEVCIEPGEG